MDLLVNNVLKIVDLSSEEIESFKHFWEIKELKKDEYLLYNGKVCRYDAFVLEGGLKGYFINPQSYREEIVFFSIADWWATDLESFHSRQPSTLNIQAITQSKVALITKDNFENLLQGIPKLERYFRIILQANASALNKRIYLRNAFSAKERYKQFVNQYPEICQQVPQYLIASYLGMSAEMLSKIRANMAANLTS